MTAQHNNYHLIKSIFYHSTREYLKILAGDVDPELGADEANEKKPDSNVDTVAVVAEDEPNTNGNDEVIDKGLFLVISPKILGLQRLTICHFNP